MRLHYFKNHTIKTHTITKYLLLFMNAIFLLVVWYALLEILSQKSQLFKISYTVTETKINRVRLCTKSLSKVQWRFYCYSHTHTYIYMNTYNSICGCVRTSMCMCINGQKSVHFRQNIRSHFEKHLSSNKENFFFFKIQISSFLTKLNGKNTLNR